MHGRSGADSLNDLLAEIAALGEIERPGLRCLLGQMAIGDVDAIARRSFEDAEGLDGIDSNWCRPCSRQGFPDRERCARAQPEFKSRTKLAIGVNESDWGPRQFGVGELQRRRDRRV